MCFWVSAAVLFGFFKSTFLGTDESPCSQEEASTSAAVIVSIDFDLHFPVLLRKRFAVICMSISPIYVQKSVRQMNLWLGFTRIKMKEAVFGAEPPAHGTVSAPTSARQP